MLPKLLAEFLGTLFLLIVVVGSGIMGDRLAAGNEAVALLANSLATGAGLYVLIQCIGPISGAHFNPVVSLVEFLWGRLSKKAILAIFCCPNFRSGAWGLDHAPHVPLGLVPGILP